MLVLIFGDSGHRKFVKITFYIILDINLHIFNVEEMRLICKLILGILEENFGSIYN